MRGNVTSDNVREGATNQAVWPSNAVAQVSGMRLPLPVAAQKSGVFKRQPHHGSGLLARDCGHFGRSSVQKRAEHVDKQLIQGRRQLSQRAS